MFDYESIYAIICNMNLAPLASAADTFDANAASVQRLATFDQIVLKIALDGMQETVQWLKKANVNNPTIPLFKTFRHLEQIHQNGSTALLYQEVYNQCLVLLVSHFESAARDLYRNTIRHAITNGTAPGLEKIMVKVALSELAATDPQERIVDLHMEQAQGLSFQDMQSIVRNFAPFTSNWTPDEGCTHDLIFAQAARHAIIHRASEVDQRMLDQVATAKHRALKPTISLGQKLTVNPAEIDHAGKQMAKYLRNLCTAIETGLEQ